MEPRNGHRVDVNQGEVVSGVRAADLPERNRAVYYPRKLFFDGRPEECTILLGERARPISGERTTLSSEHTVRTEEFRGQANCTPPPEYRPDSPPISPAREECEEFTASEPQEPAWEHWLFAEEIQDVLREGCIPFHIQNVAATSPHVRLEGLTAKTVHATKRKVDPEPSEVVVSVVLRGKRFQISINPSYLEPWAPAKGNRVVVVGCRAIGQLGKLVELKDGCCTVELESSRELSYFGVQEIVNII